jgi:hypothetical protein
MKSFKGTTIRVNSDHNVSFSRGNRAVEPQDGYIIQEAVIHALAYNEQGQMTFSTQRFPEEVRAATRDCNFVLRLG